MAVWGVKCEAQLLAAPEALNMKAQPEMPPFWA